MSKIFNENVDADVLKKCDDFRNKINSKMSYVSKLSSDILDLIWLEKLEEACPYIDNIIRNPKLTLIREEEVMKIEKVRKINVDSVKNLAKHSFYIEKINEDNDVQPSKILEIRNEETYNIYENRFIYTLLDKLNRFIREKETMLEKFSANDYKLLTYEASTISLSEKINIELNISSTADLKESNDDKFNKKIDDIKNRLSKIKKYTSNWDKSEMIKSLKRAHVHFIIPPIKKTNIILKNPNFQIATKLWEFLSKYEENNDNQVNGLSSKGNEMLINILNHSFFTNFIVLDSVKKTKKEQRESLSNYAFIMINEEIKRIVSLLYDCGIRITDEEILKMVADAIAEERNKRVIDSDDVKLQFKDAINDYMERLQEYL